MLAKLDVDSAFKLLWVMIDDAGIFATELPGNEIGLEGYTLIINLVLTFGWGGSPGNYVAFATGAKQLHEAARPEWAAWHDTVAFHNKTLMDDTVLVEPDIGIRPAMSSLRARQSLVRIFGGDAINEKKFLEEGTFATRLVVWGMEYDTEDEL